LEKENMRIQLLLYFVLFFLLGCKKSIVELSCESENNFSVRLDNNLYSATMCQGGLWQNQSNNILFLSLCLDGYYADIRFIDVIGQGNYVDDNFSLRDFSKSKDIFKVDNYFNGPLSITISNISTTHLTAKINGSLKTTDGKKLSISGSICNFKYSR
jgi:hypothetical protein